MKKIYINTMGMAFGALLFLTADANAQRGSQQATGGGSQSGSAQSAPPVAQPQRSAPQPSYTPPPQPQRSAPAPQQQTYTPPPQRTTPQQQTYTPPRTAPQQAQPRGAEHANPNVATPRNPNTGSLPQRGNQSQNGYYGRNNNRQQYQNGRGNYNPRRLGMAQGYRSYPGLEYGRNRITVRPQGLYYRNRGYYGSYYAPRLGFSMNVLPYGYYPFYYGQSLYYYSDGLYFQRNNQENSYTVVAPPIGAAIKTLPDDAQSIVINGVQYYESNGIYYEPITQDDGSIIYQIAGKDGELNTDENIQDEPPLRIGELVDALPEEYRKIKLNGQKYYITPDGYYFQDAVDSDGNKVYKVAGTPADEEEPEQK